MTAGNQREALSVSLRMNLFVSFLFASMLWLPCVAQFSQVWSKTLGFTSSAYGNLVAVDKHDNVYVVGYTNVALSGQVLAGGFDIVLMKFNSSGSRQWTRLVGAAGADFGYGG